ncbi:MAG: hypothetical protein Q8R25_01550 [bacterium]|nr:hypothetical protein [bacterium]
MYLFASVPLSTALLLGSFGLLITAFYFFVGKMYTTSKLIILTAIPALIASISYMPLQFGKLPTTHFVASAFVVALVMLALYAHTRTAMDSPVKKSSPKDSDSDDETG